MAFCLFPQLVFLGNCRIYGSPFLGCVKESPFYPSAVKNSRMGLHTVSPRQSRYADRLPMPCTSLERFRTSLLVFLVYGCGRVRVFRDSRLFTQRRKCGDFQSKASPKHMLKIAQTEQGFGRGRSRIRCRPEGPSQERTSPHTQ